jgi:serine O-acetyltransferase
MVRHALRADWRASGDPLSRISLTVYRYGQWAEHSRLNAVVLWPYRLANLLLMRAIIGCDIPRQAQIGPGLILHHGGRGVAIHKSAVLGAGCEVYQGAAVGNRDQRGAPVLGDGVRLGAYAVVVGPLRVGDGARIGPHAVVLTDIPAGVLVRSPKCEIAVSGRPLA